MEDKHPTTVPHDGGITPPRLIGRLARFFTGMFQLNFVYMLVSNLDMVTSPKPPTQPMYWVGIGLAVLLVSWTVNLGFGFRFGRWPLVIALAAGAVAAGIGLAFNGTVWGVPVAAVLTAIAVYTHGHMGICHIIGGIIATPGCEMKAIPHLIAKIRGSASGFVPCPGVWKPLDRFEARIWGPRRSTEVS